MYLVNNFALKNISKPFLCNLFNMTCSPLQGTLAKHVIISFTWVCGTKQLPQMHSIRSLATSFPALYNSLATTSASCSFCPACILWLSSRQVPVSSVEQTGVWSLGAFWNCLARTGSCCALSPRQACSSDWTTARSALSRLCFHYIHYPPPQLCPTVWLANLHFIYSLRAFPIGAKM